EASPPVCRRNCSSAARTSSPASAASPPPFIVCTRLAPRVFHVLSSAPPADSALRSSIRSAHSTLSYGAFLAESLNRFSSAANSKAPAYRGNRGRPPMLAKVADAFLLLALTVIIHGAGLTIILRRLPLWKTADDAVSYRAHGCSSSSPRGQSRFTWSRSRCGG